MAMAWWFVSVLKGNIWRPRALSYRRSNSTLQSGTVGISNGLRFSLLLIERNGLAKKQWCQKGQNMPFCKFLSCWFWGNCSTMSRVLISSRCNWGHHDSVRLQHYTCIVRQPERGLDERNPGSRMSWWFRESLGCDAIPWRRAGCCLFDLLILILAATNRDGSAQFILCPKRESILLKFEDKLSSRVSLAMVKTLISYIMINQWGSLSSLQDSPNSPFLRVLHAILSVDQRSSNGRIWRRLVSAVGGVLQGPGYCASNLDFWEINLNVSFFVGSWIYLPFEFTSP